MSDITPPEPTLPEPHRRDRWIVGTALASLMLHAGVLAVLLWQPLPKSAEAAPPAAIDVELVPPPEAVGEQPSSEEPAEEERAEAPPPAETEALSGEEPPDATEPEEAAEEATPAEPSQAEQPEEPASSPPADAAAPAQSAAEEAPPQRQTAETAAEAPEAPAPAPEATANEASEPQQAPQATAKVAPIPLARPRVRALTAESSAVDEGDSQPSAEPSEVAEGTVVAATPEEPNVATLELGEPRNVDRFYLEAMLRTPRLAPAREMLKTLPPEKRLAQTCNIEALAQIGYSGEGFTPDVVMAEAYALSEIVGPRLIANGAIFRSGERWYGLAFDCTLSDDLESVTAFSYRLGADVTEAVLARLEKT